jgi:LppX_LprAFG lipoprotein
MFRKLLPALVVPALLASACAQAADDDAVQVIAATPIEALRAAPDLAQAAGTAHFEMELRIGSEGEPAMTASGATDYETGRGSVSMEMGGLLGAFPGVDGSIDLVLADGVVYLRMPFLSTLTGTDGWISASPDDLGQDAGALGLGGGTSDPSQLLETLRGVADVVTEEGRETVRGVETTRYVATIDLDRALAEAPADQRERLEALVDELDAGLPEVPITVWVDDDGLPRRVTMELAFGSTEALPSTTMSLELFDYGEPVDIVVPSEADVTPIGDVLGPLATVFGDGSS